MLKSIFCSHEFIHYHTEEKAYFPDINTWKTYYYVCNNCGKTKEIYGRYLSDAYRKATKEKMKKIALNQDLTKYEGLELIIGYKIYHDYEAYFIRNHFKSIFKNKIK